MPVRFENGLEASNVVKVTNASGVAMTKGQVVYISGGSGDHANVSLAKADAEATSSKTIGFVWADIAIGADGLVIIDGYLDKIDTSGATAVGDAIWLSPTTAGAFVFSNAGANIDPPSAPYNSVYLGVVARKNANNGRIFVKVQNGYELQELHNVDLKTSAPTSNQVLSYDGTLWKNRSLSALTAGTGLSYGSSVTFDGSTARTIAIDSSVLTTSSSTYIGTTSVSLNRSSASQTLNGVSIDGNAGTVTNGVYTTDTGSVTSTMIANDTIVNVDINSSAAIADTKLATISTAGKVSNSATTATDANTNSAIVARDGSGNFSAGTITATLTGTATGIASGSTYSGTAASSSNKVIDQTSYIPTTVVLGGQTTLSGNVTAGTNSCTLISIPTGLVANAKVRFINLLAGSTTTEQLTVQSVSGNTVTFTTNFANSWNGLVTYVICGAYWQIPTRATRVELILTGGAGGGGGGGVAAAGTAISGGAGGGPGNAAVIQYSAADLGGAGAYISLDLGYGGAGGSSAGSGQAGLASKVYTGNYSTAFLTAWGGSAGGAGATTAPAAVGNSIAAWNNGSSGAGSTTTTAGTSTSSPGTVGGGGGGGITSGNAAQTSGGYGFYGYGYLGRASTGGSSLGVAGVSSGNGTSATTASLLDTLSWAGPGGIGGGASSAASSTGGNGGDGIRGSGGGGGGAARSTGGNGGRGGDGYCAVRYW